MTKKQILKKLTNDQEYYNGIGREYLSNSDIQALTTEPRQFHAPKKDGEAFVKGRYFHQLILEEEKAKTFPIVDTTSRSTKVYKEYVADNKLDYAMLPKDADQIKDMVEYTTANLKFFELINSPSAKYEVPGITSIEGVDWKGKADIVTDTHVFDLKTSADVFKFVSKSHLYHYHTQAYIYQKIFGKPLIFLVTGKVKKYDLNNERYYDLGLFTVGENSMGLAEEKVGQAVATYKKWFAPDSQDNVGDYIINSSI